MLIQVYGPGCANCKRLEETAQKAVVEMNLAAQVLKVQDLNDMVAAGVMRTPALAIDGQVVSQGRLLSVEQVKNLLQERIK
jgi:small redox-active disulfide protein 2